MIRFQIFFIMEYLIYWLIYNRMIKDALWKINFLNWSRSSLSAWMKFIYILIIVVNKSLIRYFGCLCQKKFQSLNDLLWRLLISIYFLKKFNNLISNLYWNSTKSLLKQYYVISKIVWEKYLLDLLSQICFLIYGILSTLLYWFWSMLYWIVYFF